jgi:sulfur carrier protein
MKILINGCWENIKSGINVRKLLQLKKLNPQIVAVEVNSRILEKQQHSRYVLQENDTIELVTFLGGG